MEEQLSTLLLNAPNITTLVPAKNIEWGNIAQGRKPPYIILQRISGNLDYHMTGASGYVVSRVQIDICAYEYGIAKNAARAVSAELSGYRGGIFQGLFIDSERDLSALDAGDVKTLYRISIDVMAHHSAS